MDNFNNLPEIKKKKKTVLPPAYTPPRPLGLEPTPRIPAFRMPQSTLGFGGMQGLTGAFADYGAGITNALNVARRNQQIINARKTLANLGVSEAERAGTIMETYGKGREIERAPAVHEAALRESGARAGFAEAGAGKARRRCDVLKRPGMRRCATDTENLATPSCPVSGFLTRPG